MVLRLTLTSTVPRGSTSKSPDLSRNSFVVTLMWILLAKIQFYDEKYSCSSTGEPNL